MALVKLTRSDGHPAIEITAVGATEEAFLQEFEETGRTARHKATLQYAFDGSRKLLFGWKSRVLGKILEKEKGYFINKVNLAFNGSFDFGDFKSECERRNIKVPYYDSPCFYKFKNLDTTTKEELILVLRDTRKCYSMRWDTVLNGFDLLNYEHDLTVEKLFEIEKRLGLL